jgi:hypothetical protein
MPNDSTLFEAQQPTEAPADVTTPAAGPALDILEGTTDDISPEDTHNAPPAGVGPNDEVVAVNRITGTPTVRRKRRPLVSPVLAPPVLRDGYPSPIKQQHAQLVQLYEAAASGERATDDAGQLAYAAMVNVGATDDDAVSAMLDVDRHAVRAAKAGITYLSAYVEFFDARKAAAGPIHGQASDTYNATYARIEKKLKSVGVTRFLQGSVLEHAEVCAAKAEERAWSAEVNGGDEHRKRAISLLDRALARLEDKAKAYASTWSVWL